MDELNVSVLQSYGIKARRVVKEKSAYILNTDRGLFMLRKSFDSPAHITFQHDVKEHLFHRGFVTTDRFLLSTTGQPYVCHADDTFTLTPFTPFKEADLANNRALERVIRETARFHAAARHITFSGRVFLSANDETLPAQYEKAAAGLLAIKRKISAQKRLSDFDVMVLKNYQYYAEQLTEGAALLKSACFSRYAARAKAENMVCHGLLKEENILMDNELVYFVNFSHTSVCHGLFDLANLIRRYAKRLPPNVVPIGDVVSLYDRNAGLSKGEAALIYPLLLYPAKFLRIVNQYYSKKRSWTPSALLNRMEAAAAGKDAFAAYIRDAKYL